MPTTELLVENRRLEDGNVTGGWVNGVGLRITWQHGPMIDGQQTGALVEDVLQAALQRLQAYDAAPLATRENALAITKIQEAMFWLGVRQKDRQARGVRGTYNP